MKLTLRGFLFEFTGLIVCALTLRIDVFNWLCAQARLETGNYSSKYFLNDRNGFGMQYPQPYASGERPGQEGRVARYSCYVASWLSRLAWDGRRTGNDWESGAGYITAVFNAGYAADPIYLRKWMDKFSSMATLPRAIGVGLETGKPSWFFKLAVASLTLALLALMLWYGYKAFKRFSNA